MSRAILLLVFVLSIACGSAFAAPRSVSVEPSPTQPIGRYLSYFVESQGRLTLDEAVAAYRGGHFRAGRSAVLSFGIGSRPVWLHLSVENSTGRPLSRRLSMGTAWLDHVDVHFLHHGKVVDAYRVGDRQRFDQRPLGTLGFSFAHRFPPGISQVFIRVATPDPMVLPIYLQSERQADVSERMQNYSYGFLYGFLIALMLYNVMLYVGLRHLRYILYSLYLGMFLLTNVSYTGHGFGWFWPDSTIWAQWSNPVLMVLYAVSGLLFALSFLDTRTHFPRLHKVVLGMIGAVCVLLALTVLLDRQRDSLLLAFGFVFVFTITMLGMGMVAVRSGQRSAKYFLFAAVASTLGASVTAMAVWGFIPFTPWTFRAVDLGMLLDATLLALALTYQFRVGQEERFKAEQLARLDHLTGINNRRAFYDIAASIWAIAQRHSHELSVVLMDIDHFKRINDAHGHGCGDDVLVATAHLLGRCVRGQDVIARWGGEEFILLLPETGIEEAAALAERLRAIVADMRIPVADGELTITASFGVAQREPWHKSLDALISSADKRLYEAKGLGRDRVVSA
ncbi:sensor domain-containing diguanylate cyclase [Acidihalobacter prosperus]